MKKYRVKEHQGLFYIELEIINEEKTGYLWWKKSIKNKGWVRCSVSGNQIIYSAYVRFYRERPLAPFNTLESAMLHIKVFLTPDRIYDYGFDYEGFKKTLI